MAAMPKDLFCIPTAKTAVPAGPDWIHEVKYDGYRVRVESGAQRRPRTSAFQERPGLDQAVSLDRRNGAEDLPVSVYPGRRSRRARRRRDLRLAPIRMNNDQRVALATRETDQPGLPAMFKIQTWLCNRGGQRFSFVSGAQRPRLSSPLSGILSCAFAGNVCGGFALTGRAAQRDFRGTPGMAPAPATKLGPFLDHLRGGGT